jgi:hypothetical protein
MNKDWRKSKEADELREYIDIYFKPRHAGPKHLDREVIIDFVAKQVDAASKRAPLTN